MRIKGNIFHLVQIRPWPLFISITTLNLFISFILWFNFSGFLFLFISILVVCLYSFVWWRDVERESTWGGFHSLIVKIGLKIGIVIFIVSEILFFSSFFWSFIHRSSSADRVTGCSWPPNQIIPFDPLSVPLVNTIVLLSSGASITWRHHLILKNKYNLACISLFVTIFLGVFFTFLQCLEYFGAPFSLCDRVLGSTFFIATGFHGLHVIVGSSFLFIVLIKHYVYSNSVSQIVGFECSAWYWHFVDVVWLFLYTLVYWW